jgi:hypothetical protein
MHRQHFAALGCDAALGDRKLLCGRDRLVVERSALESRSHGVRGRQPALGELVEQLIALVLAELGHGLQDGTHAGGHGPEDDPERSGRLARPSAAAQLGQRIAYSANAASTAVLMASHSVRL